MNPIRNAKIVRCATYTRKSTEEGLQQEFNSLDAQREAAEDHGDGPAARHDSQTARHDILCRSAACRA